MDQPIIQPQKTKKKFYKKWWFWVSALIIILVIVFYPKSYLPKVDPSLSAKRCECLGVSIKGTYANTCWGMLNKCEIRIPMPE